MSLLPVAIASVGSTGFAALSTTLKHRSATTLPLREEAWVRHLVRAASHPLLVFALLADAVALALQVTALHIGALAAVQPLLITSLVFSLVLHHRFEGTRLTRRELRYAFQLVLSLVAFLAISGVTSPPSSGQTNAADKAVAVAAAGVAIVITAALLVAYKTLKQANRAALLGVAVAIIYTTSAALIKTCGNIAAISPWDLVTSWQTYVLIGSGGLGLVLVQIAFRAGPLTASLPVIAALDPVLSVALGVLVFDEPFRSGPLAAVAEIATLGALAASAFTLSRLDAPARRPAVPAPQPAS